MDPQAPSSTPTRRISLQVLGLIAALAVIRVILTMERDLESVEAYLWLLAQHPALGYFDHPGMMAWIGWLSTHLIGHTPIGVRGLFIVTASLTVWIVFLAGRRMYGERAGRLAAFTVGLVPMLFFGAIEAKPDAPLFLFWALTLWALAHALGGGPPAWWYLAGLFLGLSMESKYHAVFLGFGVPAFLLLSPEHRPWLRRKEPWLAVAVALLAFAPTLIWNARNGWQSFFYQGVQRLQENSFSFKQVLNFPVRQLKDLTPLICLWAWVVGIRTLIRWRQADGRDRLLAATGMPLLIFFCLLVFVRNIKGYWTGPGYVSVLILSAAAAERSGVWVRRLHWASLAVLGAVWLVLPAYVARIPVERRSGWARLGSEVARRPADFVVCGDYHLASQMAFELRSLDVWEMTPVGHPAKSFANWWRPEPYLGKVAAVVTEGEASASLLERVKASFDRVDPPEEIRVPRVHLWGEKEKERYQIRRAWGYRGPKVIDRERDRGDD